MFLLFILLGCHDQKTLKRLCLADSLMFYHSDSALLLLQEITNPEKFSEKEYAYYALLITQALHKNYYTFTSDSLIRTSVEYYTKTHDFECIAKAFFYQGVVYEELGEKEQASLCYKQAENLIPKIADGYLKSLIYECLGTLNSEADFSNKAIFYYRNALEQAINIQQPHLVVANLKHIGVEYLCENQIDSAMVYYEQSMKWLPQLSSNEKAGIYHNLGAFYLNHVEAKKLLGISFLQKAIDLADVSEKLRSYAVLASYYALNGQAELADSLWAQSMHTKDDYTRAFIFHSRSLQFEQGGNYKSALAYYKKYAALSDSLFALEESRSIAEVQARYDVEAVHRKYTEICLVLTVVILLLVISLCFYQRRKRINELRFTQQLMENEACIQRLRTDFCLINQGGQKALEKETKRLGEIIETQLAFIAKLEHNSKRKSEMLTRTQSALAGMKFYILALQGNDMSQLNTKELRCLVDCYRQLNPKFFYWLEKKQVDLTPREITLCIFFHMGKNKNDIISILRCSDGSYRTMKNRIKKEFQIDAAHNDVEAFVKSMR